MVTDLGGGLAVDTNFLFFPVKCRSPVCMHVMGSGHNKCLLLIINLTNG